MRSDTKNKMLAVFKIHHFVCEQIQVADDAMEPRKIVNICYSSANYRLSRCWRDASSTKSERVSPTIGPLPHNLSKNFIFFLFQLLQKILSRRCSPGCPSLSVQPKFDPFWRRRGLPLPTQYQKLASLAYVYQLPLEANNNGRLFPTSNTDMGQ